MSPRLFPARPLVAAFALVSLVVTRSPGAEAASQAAEPLAAKPSAQVLPGVGAPVEAVDVSRVPAHPRLLALAADWEALPARLAADRELDAYVKVLVANARAELARPRLERVMTGKRLLFVSRQLIHTVVLCAFAHRVTGEQAFLERARRDMLDAAAFSDWNPSHFLDVAEMAAGLAIGYDWLHASLTPAERGVLRQALVSKALRQVENGHHTLSLPNNWAQVCGGGLALAALAVAEDEPALAARVLGRVRAGSARPLAAYAPEGAFPEGPGYWYYGTLYETVLVAALRGALGDDWGILASPGFRRSAEYQAQCTGPTGLWFNYADAGRREGINEPLCYLAREAGQSGLAWNTRRLLPLIGTKDGEAPDRFAPLLVFWWPFGKGAAPVAAQSEPARFFSAQGPNPVAIWRSAWNERKARYFAIKAGGAGVSHGHMDAGSFVLDWQGKRWASDLGMQEYNSLEQAGISLWNMGQTSSRWSIFRLGAESHNTVTVEGQAHAAKGLALLREADAHGALIDLSPALFLQAGQALRSVRINRERIVLEDRVEGLKAGARLRWAMTTPATITLGPGEAVLTQDGRTLRIRFEGSECELADLDIAPPRTPLDAPNPGMRQLVARVQAKADGRVLLRVVIEAAE